ncbi:MAG TPA: J domain-containing protein [Tepidisphaeraceae bacterium]|jgi:curved DNA-binding protein|nr:J domain-containing protein [Tepidisphaeraceae bacterium]
MAKRDYYEVLGINRNASADEIKKAHRKLVRKYHPDVNRDNPTANEQFKEVQEAYDVLSDVPKRQNYDQFGHAGVDAGAAGAAGVDPFEAFRRAQQTRGRTRRGAPGEEFDYGPFGGGGATGADFSSVFEQMFGGNATGRPGGRAGPGAGRRYTPPTRGADVEHPVTLSFEQAARGVTLPLQINRDGRLETIDIKIPPGVKDGSRVRIKGRGQQSDAGGGDLYIITTVRPHAYYRRDGLDISVDVPMSLYEALLGTKVEVPTLDGMVTVTIPPGTNSGSRLRIKGRGVFRGEEKGDQYVVTKVIVPKNLSPEATELVKQLQAAQPLDARSDVKW